MIEPDSLAKAVHDIGTYSRTLGEETTRYNSFLIDGNRSDRRMDRIARWLPATLKGGFTLILQPAKDAS